MKKQKTGGAAFASILSIALICSVVLNVSLISGCKLVEGLIGKGEVREPRPPAPTVDVSEIRLKCMREVATAIGVEYGPGMTASDILSTIRMTVKPKNFNGKVLSEKDIKAASAMLSPDVVSALRENQKFLSEIEGKKLLVIEPVQR